MSFELIMLLGFFGAGLLGLLPENPEQPAEEDLCRRQRGKRSDTGTYPPPARHGQRVPRGNQDYKVNHLRRGNRAGA